MAQLAVSIISSDDPCKREMSRMLRASGVPVGIVEERRNGDATTSDVYIIDIRSDASSGMATIERLRAAHPGGRATGEDHGRDIHRSSIAARVAGWCP